MLLLYVNILVSSGYYRVNYEPANWVALANQLNSSHETIHLLNRAQILDDAFNLARTGDLVCIDKFIKYVFTSSLAHE